MPDKASSTLTEFVRTANIAAFAKQLKTETDPVRRKLLLTLLDEHKAMAPLLTPAMKTPAAGCAPIR